MVSGFQFCPVPRFPRESREHNPAQKKLIPQREIYICMAFRPFRSGGVGWQRVVET